MTLEVCADGGTARGVPAQTARIAGPSRSPSTVPPMVLKNRNQPRNRTYRRDPDVPENTQKFRLSGNAEKICSQRVLLTVTHCRHPLEGTAFLFASVPTRDPYPVRGYPRARTVVPQTR